jgi:hypothetical protein
MDNYTVLFMGLVFGLAFGVPALISVLRQRHDKEPEK